jgi:hypothetical protein
LHRGSVRFSPRARAGSAPVLIFVASKFHLLVLGLRITRLVRASSSVLAVDFPIKIVFLPPFPAAGVLVSVSAPKYFSLANEFPGSRARDFLSPGFTRFGSTCTNRAARFSSWCEPDSRAALHAGLVLSWIHVFRFPVSCAARLHARFPIRSRSEHAPSSSAQAQVRPAIFPPGAGSASASVLRWVPVQI